ncbi:heterokaryon incompatibility protein-domain-containing protein [Boeremia exigua]|uniref:heterokaryon incompatibility protein-domain-containing protein n=1 Tax=Boeremia exigua TaxID=749465 RepID=UPI001E8EA7BD|nr:heterokaryon incompatibility protein-domain-containing protein [Boeremia exigua]KAH6618759.1 heterokaryon incompatibility protein-domain-containing protein [Boeremia exigua]
MDVDAPSPAIASVFSEPVDETSIRLLRFSQPEDGVFVGKLQKFRLASAPHYYTASYVWGERKYTDTSMHLKSGTLPVLSSLAPFIHMVTHHKDFQPADWWWIDSLCINLQDAQEREKQVRIMAEIYRKARRAIVWLGEEKEDGSDCTTAIDFLHFLSSMQIAFKGDEIAMRNSLENPDFAAKCVAVSDLLARPWWTRVWTLQEFVLPKEAKLYCGTASISRGKFKSAIYSIFLCSTISNDFEHELVPRKLFDVAFNRRRIHQWHTKPAAVGINLIAIMASLGNHSATDSRDRVYSVLGLITDQDRALIGPAEYSTSTQHQFARLVRSFWNVRRSLDIVCFMHIFSREAAASDPGLSDAVPTWAPDWRTTIDFSSPVPLMASQSSNEHIGNFRPLRSIRWKATYDAPGSHLRKRADVHFTDDLTGLQCNGVLLDTIHGLGGLDATELRCRSFVCKDAGHYLLQSNKAQPSAPRAVMQPTDWLEAIARSLVIDRQDKYLCFQAPVHYFTDFLFLCHACIDGHPVDWSFSTWFEHNRDLRFGDYTLENLISQVPSEDTSPPPILHRPSSHPTHQMNDKLDTFLSRFHDTVRKKSRRLMVTEEGIVGVAPCRAKPGDMVVIIYGCSIPLVLRMDPSLEAWQVLGEAYVHGYMNGEVSNLVRRGKKATQSIRLV